MRHRSQGAGAAHLHPIDSTVVTACRAGYLYAMAQRGALAVKPSARCCGMESTFTTTPSISYGSSSRCASQCAQKASTSSISAHSLRSGFTLKPRRASSSERFPVAVEHELPAGQQEIRVVIETPRCSDLRLQYTQRARGRVARIGEAGEAAFIALGVEPFEGLPVQHGFAAHFEFGELAFGAQRQRADGARVFGDVLARGPSPRVTA
jgi:hypothetical protein